MSRYEDGLRIIEESYVGRQCTDNMILVVGMASPKTGHDNNRLFSV
jgi:hypothetical protein